MISFLFSSAYAADYSFVDITRVVNEFQKFVQAGDTITAKGSETKGNFILFTNFDNCIIDIDLIDRNTTKIQYQYHYDSKSLEPFIQCMAYNVEIRIQAQKATKVKFTIYATNDCSRRNGYSLALNYPSSMNLGKRSKNEYYMNSYTNKCVFGAFEYDTKISVMTNYWASGIPGMSGCYLPGTYSYYSALDEDKHRKNVEHEILTSFTSSFLFDFTVYLAGEASVSTVDTGSTATKEIFGGFLYSIPEQKTDNQNKGSVSGIGTKSDYIIGVVTFLLIAGMFALIGFFVLFRKKEVKEETSEITENLI